MVKKKNSELVAINQKTVEFIAPASFFKGINQPIKKEQQEDTTITSADDTQLKEPQRAVIPEPQKAVEEKATIANDSKIQDTPAALEPAPKQAILVEQKSQEPIASKKIEIRKPEKRVSGLSISSLKAKKEHELNKKDNSIDESQLPNEEFTKEVMQEHWAKFVQKIDDDGRKILASNLHSDIPKLIDKNVLWIQLPNDTMKKEVEREQYDLIEYLKLKLNNHFISLKITVNEETAKKYAFTPEEKYEKLREKNPAIDLLRKEFDLDL